MSFPNLVARPRQRLLGPNALGRASLQLLRDLAKDGVIIRALVMAHRAPVTSLRCDRGIRILPDHLAIDPFRIRPSLLLECDPSQGHLQLLLELLLGK